MTSQLATVHLSDGTSPLYLSDTSTFLMTSKIYSKQSNMCMYLYKIYVVLQKEIIEFAKYLWSHKLFIDLHEFLIINSGK